MFVYFNLLNSNKSFFYTLIKVIISFDQNDTKNIIDILNVCLLQSFKF